MVLMNELLKEAADRATELTKELGEAGAAIEELTEGVQSLSQKVTEEGEDAHRAAEEMASRLTEAEQQLETSTAEAEGALDALAEKARAAQAQVTELLEQVRRSVDELENQKEAAETALETHAEQSTSDFRQLADTVAQVQGDAGERLQSAAAAVADFRAAVDAARAEFDQGKQRFVEAAEDLESVAVARTHEYADAVGAALMTAGQGLLDMGNAVLTAHNEAVVALRRKYAEEAREKLAAALEPLKETIAEVIRLCGDQETELEKRCEGILETVPQAMQLVDRIKPVLAQADRLS